LNATEHARRSPAAKAGLFAPLRAASSVAKGSGVSSLRLLAPLGLALVALLALAAIPASALAAPPTEFGTEGAGAGQISNEAQGIAVDNEDSVYVADNHNRIDKLDLLANFFRAGAAA
jgi:hypothetical protein